MGGGGGRAEERSIREGGGERGWEGGEGEELHKVLACLLDF